MYDLIFCVYSESITALMQSDAKVRRLGETTHKYCKPDIFVAVRTNRYNMCTRSSTHASRVNVAPLLPS